MTRSVCSALVLSMALLLSVPAHANSGILLNFIGLGDSQSVANFYNGGGLSVTPNYGVSFTSNFFGLRSYLNGGSGDFSRTPVGTPAIFITGTLGSPVTGVMNVANGFSSGLNFYYAALLGAGQSETVSIWSGANGKGTLLATIVLGSNEASCSSPLYCTWSVAGTNFTGTGRSVTFVGPANELGITDITLGASSTAIPEPSAIYLLGTGIVAISFARMRKFFGV